MRILVVGDTISAEDSSDTIVKYPSILKNTINDCQLDNKSTGALSDDEIMYKVYDNCFSYDLTIVQFGMYLRFSVIPNNHEDPYTFCLMSNNSLYKTLDYEWRSNFINRYQTLSRWLTKITVFTDWLSKNDQKFIMIRGFDNYFRDLANKDWKGSSSEYRELVLKVTELPDDIIDQRHNILHNKFKQLKDSSENNWLNFTTPSIVNSMVDLYQDYYPGATTHQDIANMVKSKAKSLGFL